MKLKLLFVTLILYALPSLGSAVAEPTLEQLGEAEIEIVNKLRAIDGIKSLFNLSDAEKKEIDDQEKTLQNARNAISEQLVRILFKIPKTDAPESDQNSDDGN